MKATRRDGTIDFAQGDTKGIGSYSQIFDRMPFAQGMGLYLSKTLDIYEKLLVDIWNCLFDCYLTVRNSLYLFMDIPYRKVVIAPHVVSIEETIRYIIQSHCSVSRLGDGEIKIANGKALAFQTQQPLLQQKCKRYCRYLFPITSYACRIYLQT